MTISDYLLDIGLISIVLVQLRGRRLTARSLLLPLAIVGYVAYQYLHSIPTSGNDLVLIVGCAGIGAVLGGLAGIFTKVTNRGGAVFAQAGAAAATLWILGTGARLAFQLYATHGGGPELVRFSMQHDITTTAAWTAALILMALCEVVLRTGVLAWRANALQRHVALRFPMRFTAEEPLTSEKGGL